MLPQPEEQQGENNNNSNGAVKEWNWHNYAKAQSYFTTNLLEYLRRSLI